VGVRDGYKPPIIFYSDINCKGSDSLWKKAFKKHYDAIEWDPKFYYLDSNQYATLIKWLPSQEVAEKSHPNFPEDIKISIVVNDFVLYKYFLYDYDSKREYHDNLIRLFKYIVTDNNKLTDIEMGLSHY